MNEYIKIALLCAFCFAAGIFAGMVTGEILHNGRTAAGTGERIETAKGTASEAARTAGEIAESVERSREIIEEIRKQKID